jgi:hypothetical protein
MGTEMRVPAFKDKSMEGMRAWFAAMADADLLFHPDDSPESIIKTASGERLFSNAENAELVVLIDEMFSLYGDEVYEAAYPVFMKGLVSSWTPDVGEV